MATFLLFWNPFFSSYKLQRFLNEFNFASGRNVLRSAEKDWDRSPNFFDWSIIEHEKAHKGDRFFFIRVGYEKPTGLIGAGHFVSEPFEDEDWSGQGRKTYYVKMVWEDIVNPVSDKVLKTEDLAVAIPEIVWTKGKAGVMISEDVAAKLEALWSKHLEEI